MVVTMLDFFKNVDVAPFLYGLGVLCGFLIKHYVYDKAREYIIEKLKPGIIQDYLEEMLGMNKKAPLPPVMIIPIRPQSPQSNPEPQQEPILADNPPLASNVLQGLEDGFNEALQQPNEEQK